MPRAGESYIRIVETFKNRLEREFDPGKNPSGSPSEGWALPIALDAAVPLWQHHFRNLSWEEKQRILEDAQKDELCLRMEFLLHRGPKKGDSARAFNDLARCIAILSFVPGGVCVFGRRWEYGKIGIPVKK